MTKRFVCKVGDVQPDALREFDLDAGGKVCLVNAGGTLFACQATCPHEGVRLCEGCVDDSTLTCLEHLWQWDLRTGEPCGLAEAPLTMFELEIEGDDVYVKSSE
jgi:toluene monooxygenase system ferredoxin subunit